MDEDFKPLPKIEKIDFTYYHPADHHFWQCQRRNAYQPIYGGMFVHLVYYFAFARRWKVPVLSGLADSWVHKRLR
jgi:hypothetical protein